MLRGFLGDTYGYLFEDDEMILHIQMIFVKVKGF